MKTYLALIRSAGAVIPSSSFSSSSPGTSALSNSKSSMRRRISVSSKSVTTRGWKKQFLPSTRADFTASTPSLLPSDRKQLENFGTVLDRYKKQILSRKLREKMNFSWAIL
uniref:Uncharacterized protein n=1 Tax=Romanomermis culicivorax TaxID=13658 RepID=A0A915HG76_ROMCU